jgi:hypothetical protein
MASEQLLRHHGSHPYHRRRHWEHTETRQSERQSIPVVGEIGNGLFDVNGCMDVSNDGKGEMGRIAKPKSAVIAGLLSKRAPHSFHGNGCFIVQA